MPRQRERRIIRAKVARALTVVVQSELDIASIEEESEDVSRYLQRVHIYHNKKYPG